MDDDYERVLCVKPEVFVYKIPPRTTTRGYRASEWKLDQPDWTGRMRIVHVGGQCIIKFEDKISGDLFAQAPVPDYPGVSVEAVLDSSRYFVVKVQDGARHAFIGMGFADRGDSFDMNVALQDHFKREKQSKMPEKDEGPKLDLGFKEGQTIKINLGNKNVSESKARPKQATGPIGILPPPPGTKTPLLAPPPGSSPQTQAHGAFQSQFTAPPAVASGQDEWGDFSSASSSGSGGNSWVTF